MGAKTTDAGDISAIMGEGSSSASANKGAATKAGPSYDIWYLLKVLLVLIIIVGVADYFMNRRKIIAENENENEPKSKKSKK